MRFLLALIGLAAVVAIGLWAMGLLTIGATPGTLPHLEGGKAPAVTANIATISVGTENKAVTVPTVTTERTSVAVPTITVNKPAQPGNTAAAQ